MLNRKFKCLYPYGVYPYAEAPDYTMDFSTGVLPKQSIFSRPAIANSIATGIVNNRLTEFPDGGPRFCDDGILLESISTNYLIDPRLENAKYNIGSTTPFFVFAFPHFTFSVVGKGTENGIPYFDVRCQRTVQAGTSYGWAMQDPLLIPINAGGISTPQWFIISAYVKIVGGSTANITSLRVGWQQFIADGVTPATGANNALATSIDITTVNTTGGLITGRYWGFGNSTNVAGVCIAPTIGLVVTTNAVVDITLRIGAPQFESCGVTADTNPQQIRETGYASSVILPPVGAPGRTSRSSDFLICPAMNTSLSPLEQSVAVEGTYNALGINSTGITMHVVSIDDGSSGIRSTCMQNSNNGAWRSTVNWSDNTSNLQSAANLQSKFLIACANKQDNSRFALNASMVTNQLGVPGSFPGGVTSRIMLCDTQLYWASKSFIKRVRVWNHFLSDSDLLEYTTPPVWDAKFAGSVPFPTAVVYARAGTAYAQYDYKLQTLAANAPELGNTVVHLDPPSTNSVRNARLEGGVVNTSLPTNVVLLNAGGGQTCTMVAQGTTAEGWPYVDLRVQKTTGTNSGAFRIAFEAANIITAVPGEVWSASMYIQRIAGTWNNVDATGQSINIGSMTFTSGNASVNSSSEQQYKYEQMEVPLGQFRSQTIFTVAATVAYLRPTFAWNSPATGPVDITLRITCPQIEKLPFASQIMLPTAGTPAASTRNAATAMVTTLGNIFYSINEGTIIAEFLSNYGASSTMTADGNIVALDIAASTANNRMQVYIDGTTKEVKFALRNSGSYVIGPVVLGAARLYGTQMNRVAVSYKYSPSFPALIVHIAFNNYPIQSFNLNSDSFVNFNRLVLLNATDNYNPAGVGLRRLRYYNKGLGDSSISVEAAVS